MSMRLKTSYVSALEEKRTEILKTRNNAMNLNKYGQMFRPFRDAVAVGIVVWTARV